MGDGRVALILDVLGLAQSSGLVETRQEKEASGMVLEERDERDVENKQSLLLFESKEGGRMAVELSMVARLEEFARESVEKTGELEVVQYRGQIMPLIRVSAVLGETGENKEADEAGPMQVVVYANEGRNIGLVVEQILDIVEECVELQQPAKRAGVRGTMVLQKKVTDLLDVKELVRMSGGEESPAEEGHSDE